MKIVCINVRHQASRHLMNAYAGIFKKFFSNTSLRAKCLIWGYKQAPELGTWGIFGHFSIIKNDFFVFFIKLTYFCTSPIWKAPSQINLIKNAKKKLFLLLNKLKDTPSAQLCKQLDLCTIESVYLLFLFIFFRHSVDLMEKKKYFKKAFIFFWGDCRLYKCPLLFLTFPLALFAVKVVYWLGRLNPLMPKRYVGAL